MVKKKIEELKTPAESEEPRVVIHLRPGNFISGIPMRDLTATEWMGISPGLRRAAQSCELYEIPKELKEDESNE